MSLPVNIRRLSRDGPTSDREAAIQVCVDAFRDNRLIDCCIAGHKSLLYQINETFIGAALVGGSVYVAELPLPGGGKKVVAAAAWFGPGEGLLASEGQAEAGWNNFMAELVKKDPDMTKWWSTFLPEYETWCQGALGSDKYKLAGYHLQWIGVQPSYQRQGIGRALVNHVKELACSNPNPEARHMCLETDSPDGRKFYEAVGFIEKGTYTFQAETKLNATFQMWSYAQEL